MYYYQNQFLSIEYTQQHSCASGNAKCDTIIQYYCSPLVRDGETTDTIPEDIEKSEDKKYGMHENYNYYRQCKYRVRNHHLFTTQRLNGKTAKYTRQDRKGERYGFECPEERDYFPYWGPSPWTTIAVLTDYRNCQKLKNESEKIGYCSATDAQISKLGDERIPLTSKECTAMGLKWQTRTDSSFYCGLPQFSRDNHHGNNGKLGHSKFEWLIPDTTPTDTNCVIRVRYNISTADYNTDFGQHERSEVAKEIQRNVGFRHGGMDRRGYQLVNDPGLIIFANMSAAKLELNVNTDQYGRTFQDRSHVFQVKKPANTRNNVYDLTLAGKRGNVAQVYPNTAFHFAPSNLGLFHEDKINFHFTGSDSNNAMNDGKGPKGSDIHQIGIDGRSTYLWPDQHSTPKLAYDLSLLTPDDSMYLLGNAMSSVIIT